jgi:hypothetical protein
VSVCAVDGVEVTIAKRGNLVHLADLPKGVDPDHVIVAVPGSDYGRGREARFTLKGAAEDMLIHHATLHPADGCEWAAALERALRTS